MITLQFPLYTFAGKEDLEAGKVELKDDAKPNWMKGKVTGTQGRDFSKVKETRYKDVPVVETYRTPLIIEGLFQLFDSPETARRVMGEKEWAAIYGELEVVQVAELDALKEICKNANAEQIQYYGTVPDPEDASVKVIGTQVFKTSMLDEATPEK